MVGVILVLVGSVSSFGGDGGDSGRWCRGCGGGGRNGGSISAAVLVVGVVVGVAMRGCCGFVRFVYRRQNYQEKGGGFVVVTFKWVCLIPCGPLMSWGRISAPLPPTPPMTQLAATAAAVTAASTQRPVISLDLSRQLPVDCYADNCFIIDMSSLITVLWFCLKRQLYLIGHKTLD